MKIKRIVLYNLGPYFEHNEISIDCDKSENIILIGGKNGAGKTTLFNSLRVCLYGCKAFGHEVINQKYLTEIMKLINDKEKTNAYGGYARVEADLILNDGIDNNTYTLIREWSIVKNSVKEIYYVKLNGTLLDKIAVTDFENYLMHLLPPNLFKFYFFDGEKIGDIFLQSNEDNSFRNAFLTVSGYDNIDIMLKQFQRTSLAKNKNAKAATTYFQMESELRAINENLAQIKKTLRERNEELATLQDIINTLELNYVRSGGLSLEKWQGMNKQLADEEAKREGMHRTRKDWANSQLPYMILGEKLAKLKAQILLEDEIRKSQIISSFFDKSKLIKIVSKRKDINKATIAEIVGMISDHCKKQVGSTDGSIILDLATQVKNEILVQIEGHLDFDRTQLTKLFKDIDKSLKESVAIRKQIEHYDTESYNEYIKVKEEKIKERHAIECIIKALEKELFEIEIRAVEKDAEFKKAKKAYEEELKSASVNDISSQAVLAFSNLSEYLFRELIKKVEDGFKRIFFSLINKKDFIHGITIDEKLNIFPFREEGGKRVIITSPFSQGENQIYIMSIYFALMELSKIKVPFVIDTPFARIDNEHRKNVINNFLLKLKGQIFILSTDEEITKENESKLDKHINRRFLLQYQNRGKTRIIADQYFGGENDI